MIEFENLQVGDVVAIDTTEFWASKKSPLKVGIVTRVLKRYVELDDGFKYTRGWGKRYGYGDSYNAPRIMVKTLEEIKAYNAEKYDAWRKKRLANGLRGMNWHQMELERLEEIAELAGVEISDED